MLWAVMMLRLIRWARGCVVTRGSSSVVVARVAFVKIGEDVVDDQKDGNMFSYERFNEIDLD